MQRIKTELQSLLERCEDEEKRRDLEKKIRECDEKMEMMKQELKDTVTTTNDDDDDDDKSGKEGKYIQLCMYDITCYCMSSHSNNLSISYFGNCY